MHTKATTKSQDRVDVTLKKWKNERPDLNASAKAVVGRIIRLQGVILSVVTKSFKKHGINPGEYAVLCNLRVNGHPHQMSPTQISQNMLLTSGGMSNLLERMENKNLITRIHDPNDRRGVLVQLTQEGKKIIDAAMTEHVQVERELISHLSKDEKLTLEVLLKKLLTHLDPILY
jgi:DNA-binding MarR family transcriptional regulator